MSIIFFICGNLSLLSFKGTYALLYSKQMTFVLVVEKKRNLISQIDFKFY